MRRNEAGLYQPRLVQLRLYEARLDHARLVNLKAVFAGWLLNNFQPEVPVADGDRRSVRPLAWADVAAVAPASGMNPVVESPLERVDHALVVLCAETREKHSADIGPA